MTEDLFDLRFEIELGCSEATARQSDLSLRQLSLEIKFGCRWAQALAALRGRDFVVPDEVKELASAVLAHRVILKPEARMNGVAANWLVEELLSDVPVPQ